jgi:hypothetical protein
MYRRVIAFDFDGTLAVDGNVPAEVETALEQCRNSGQFKDRSSSVNRAGCWRLLQQSTFPS